MRASVGSNLLGGFGRGVLHFLVVFLVRIHLVFIFILVAGDGGIEAWRRWLDHGRICCFEICDTLFEIAQVFDASLDFNISSC